ncbi:MAG: hypothetical protein JWR89_4046 [Tardiphaga sp.]|uniref:transglutaminase-like cysteine peptidase n=1 Tax=Tardiphaga sp. TaxID=1926292 RepID=UPI00261BEC08|nr:transglutaminase-like cysteine peptidase [Tardiphaga sp.]MDB5504144.1 hypothetical protein [Tardiphaga sp.]
MVLSQWRVMAPAIALCLNLSAAWSPASAALDRSGSYAARSLPSIPFGNLPNLGADEKTAEPFGNATTGISSGGLIRKWQDVQTGLAREYQTLNECRRDPASCATAPTLFLSLIETSRNLTGLARITAVNRAINLAIRPMTDLAQYGQAELWATPLMTFTSGAGDCEDYAIAKYAALIQLGVSPDDLRLVVAYDRGTRENHAVAAVRLEQRWLILDNIAIDVRDDAGSTNLDPLFILGDQWVRRVDTTPKPPAINDVDPANRFRMSDLPENLSIKFGLIDPVL